MDTKSLAVQIRSGFEDTINSAEAREAHRHAAMHEPLLAVAKLAELPELVHGRLAPQAASEVLAAVVRSYQRGPQKVWGFVVLEMLAPAVMDITAKLHVGPASMTDEDLYQQLATEVLHVAARVRTDDARWMKLRIAKQVRKRLVRCLIAEIQEQHDGQDVLDWIVVEPPVEEFDDIDLVALHRMKIRGERAVRLAAERGLSIHQMRHRLRVARQRVIKQRAA